MSNLFTEFEKSTNEHPSQVCMTHEEIDFSFESILSASKRLAAKLLEMAPGDSEADRNIGLLSPNLPGFLVGFYGTLAADKVSVPINFMLNPKEMVTIGRHAGIRILIAAGPFYEQSIEMAKEHSLVLLRAEDFFVEAPIPDLPPVTRHEDDTAVIMYTSGTTGNPKGVELTHTNLYANYTDTRSSFALRPDHTFVCVLPLFHSFGLTTMMLLANVMGAHLVLVTQFQPHRLAEIFNKYKNCIFFGVAPHFRFLAQFAKGKGIQYSKLEMCMAGAAALPMDVKEDFEAATGVTLFQGYGLSEASPVVSLNNHDNHKPGTVGPPISNVEVAVWDDDGNLLPVGEIGELMVRGKNVMKGYYKNPETTSAAISEDGWLHSGDLAKIDDDGFITIAGRKKELIICAGENIYPLEIEDVLMTHPSISEAAVVGIPHKKKGEEAKAYVTLAPEASVTVAELRDLCKDRIAAFKVPAEFEIIQEMPKGPTGKILKRVLAERARMEG